MFDVCSRVKAGDSRTATSPVFASRNLKARVIVNRALRVNRMDWRARFFDRNRGAATLRPWRVPVTDAKKLRYAVFNTASACRETTADTSRSPACFGARFAALNRRDSSASEMWGSGRAGVLVGS